MRLYASCICCLLNKQEQKLRNCRDEKKKTEYKKELLRLAGIVATRQVLPGWQPRL